MSKHVKYLHQININVFDAIKRAYIRRGIVPPGSSRRKKHRTNEKESENVTFRKENETADEPEYRYSAETKSATAPRGLEELAEKSHEVLFEAETVFPFTLFPDTISLDREKLTIANRFFWRTATITSVPIGEIMSAEAIVGPFFGSLHLTFRFFANNERSVNFLTHKDVIEMQRLIHGFIIAHRREIDTSHMNMTELKDLLCDLGQGVSD
jgi:hypothetical protein